MDTNGYKADKKSPKNVTSVTSQLGSENSSVTENVTGNDETDLFETGFNTAWDVQQRRIKALLAENEELRERIDELEDELYYEEDRANCFEDEAEAAWDELGY